jgi:hypothetical protein
VLIAIVFTLLLTILIFALGIMAIRSRISKQNLVVLFTVSIALSVVMGLLGVATYPFSNILVIAVAFFGGSLLGKTSSRRIWVLFAPLTIFSAIDIASFLLGAQGTSPSSVSSQQSSGLALLNFTLYFADGSHFRIGTLDIFVLSALVVFFAERGYKLYGVFFISLFAMLLPYAYSAIVRTSGGLPLIPFMELVAVTGYLLRDGLGKTSLADSGNLCSSVLFLGV